MLLGGGFFLVELNDPLINDSNETNINTLRKEENGYLKMIVKTKVSHKPGSAFDTENRIGNSCKKHAS